MFSVCEGEGQGRARGGRFALDSLSAAVSGEGEGGREGAVHPSQYKYTIQIHNTNTQYKYTIHITQYKYICTYTAITQSLGSFEIHRYSAFLLCKGASYYVDVKAIGRYSRYCVLGHQ